MRIAKSGIPSGYQGGVESGVPASGPPLLVEQPLFSRAVSSQQLVVGTVAVPFTGLRVGYRGLIVIRNVSTAGQIVRVGTTPFFSGTPALESGVPLYPGDALTLTDWGGGGATGPVVAGSNTAGLNVVADAAGARVSWFPVESFI